MPIKCNYNNKSCRVPHSGTLWDFLSSARSQLSDPELDSLIESDNLVLQYDYPKKQVEVLANLDTPLEALGLTNGQQAWLVSKNQSKGLSEGPALQNFRAQGPKFEGYYTKCSDGYCVIREMDDDNSCLFHAISYCLFATANEDSLLRGIVGAAVEADPAKFSEAYLGKPNSEYAQWIRKKTSWGGAIELDILARHFQVAVHSVDVLTGRVDSFGGPCMTYIVVFYGGIHFDALAFNKSQTEWSLERKEGDVMVFQTDSGLGKSVLLACKDLAGIMKNRGYATDMANIVISCEQCGKKMSGEKQAMEHVKETGHTDFQQGS